MKKKEKRVKRKMYKKPNYKNEQMLVFCLGLKKGPTCVMLVGPLLTP